MNNVSYSVLMSVYRKENPDYFVKSVNSMLNQTLPPDEIVIVKDGILTAELEAVCVELQNKTNKIVFVPLENNVGLGLALQKGLLCCKNEYVARMDTDDISASMRCEKQIKFLMDNPSVDVVGSYISEFQDDEHSSYSLRVVPVTDTEIKRYIKHKCPFNHPTVIFKKSSVLRCGNYENVKLTQDYYLWIKMLIGGCNFANIAEPLLFFRVGTSGYSRRSGIKYFLIQKHLFDFMLKNNIINHFDWLINIFVRILRLCMPSKMLRFFYIHFLRKRPDRR